MSRQAEIAKYVRCFQDPNYKMGEARRKEWRDYLQGIMGYRFKSLCDVGTGRGEALEMAFQAGYTIVRGYDVVPYLCKGHIRQIDGIHNLPDPDNTYDVVSCQDVLEHIEEADVADGLAELIRIARCRVYLSIAWFSSTWRGMDGEELHITRHPTDWWEDHVWQALPSGSYTRVLEQVRGETCRIEIVKRTLPDRHVVATQGARSGMTQGLRPSQG